MKRTKDINPIFSTCPYRNVLSKVCDYWSLLVVDALRTEPLRYNAITNRIPDISNRLLTVTLKSLISLNMVEKIEMHEENASYRKYYNYQLTSKGLSFLPILKNMVEWAEKLNE